MLKSKQLIWYWKVRYIDYWVDGSLR